MTNDGERRLIFVGGFMLDLDRETLSGPAGEIRVRPKTFEVLRYLLMHRGRVVTKQALIDAVWRDTCVTDDSLVQCLIEIRRALQDDGHRLIKTIPRRGYMVATEFDAPHASPRWHGDAFAGALEPERPGAESVNALHQPICWFFCGSREFPLPDGEHLVGREPNARIFLDSPKVSRRHARIIVNGRNATLEDLGSKNGLFVRGVRISAPIALEPGDDARIGPFTLIFRAGVDSGSTASEVR